MLEALSTNYWFVPGLMVLAGLMLGVLLTSVDYAFGTAAYGPFTAFLSVDVAGLRSILSTIAGSTITVAGVMFSVTIVALTLASSQFGPRLLRHFMRDNRSQFVLGAWLATFAYCLIVLGAARGNGEVEFVPALATAGGLGLALVNVLLLVYYIHHVAESIRAPVVIAAIGSELEESLKALFPDDVDSPDQSVQLELPDYWAEQSVYIRNSNVGYVQAVNTSALLGCAHSYDLVVELLHRPGFFVPAGSTLMRVLSRTEPGPLPELVIRELQGGIILGPLRTPEQDVGFLFEQLNEIAIRALSPGVNEPYTALSCIDQILNGLLLLSSRAEPASVWLDHRGQPRILAPVVGFEGLVEQSLGQIMPYVGGNPLVQWRLEAALSTLKASGDSSRGGQVINELQEKLSKIE